MRIVKHGKKKVRRTEKRERYWGQRCRRHRREITGGESGKWEGREEGSIEEGRSEGVGNGEKGTG